MSLFINSFPRQKLHTFQNWAKNLLSRLCPIHFEVIKSLNEDLLLLDGRLFEVALTLLSPLSLALTDQLRHSLFFQESKR
jgi:hypothetical protein